MHNIALLTVLDVEQNILRVLTFQCKSQRESSFKIYEKIELKKLYHIERTTHIEQLIIRPHGMFSQILSHIVLKEYLRIHPSLLLEENRRAVVS